MQRDGDQPRFASRRPAPALRDHVARYVGYRVDGIDGAVHRGLPSRHMTMIISIGEPVRVLAQTDPTQPPGTYGFVLGGLQLGPALVAAHHRQEGVTVELTPLGSRALLALPAGALWNTTVEADAVMGTAAQELHHRLQDTATWEERFATCDEVLLRAVHPRAHEVEDRLAAAWHLLVTSGGAIRVRDLADELGWSRRHLAQRFTDEFGLSPKAAARVVRFERSCALLRLPHRPPLAEVAVAAGYYDQAHLTREFTALAGSPPAQWLAAELPFVQDSA